MFVLDTSVIIQFLRGRLPGFLKSLEAGDPRMFAVPAVVLGELLVGAEKSRNSQAERRKVERFVASFKVLPFDEDAARIYGSVRAELEKKGTPIGSNDMLIAAIALAHGATLVTLNDSEFKRVPGLRIECWEELDLGEV